MINVLLPNHAKAIYNEMKQVVEERIGQFDVKKWLRVGLESGLMQEFEAVIGVSPYERSEQRRNYRNGFYVRSLDTVYGWIEKNRG